MRNILINLFICSSLTIAAGIEPPKPDKREKLEQKFTPAVVAFVERCMDDHRNRYTKAEAWLRAGRDDDPDHDQMWEILSGLVWAFDRPRARILALEINNLEKRKAVLRHYEGIEQLPLMQ